MPNRRPSTSRAGAVIGRVAIVMIVVASAVRGAAAQNTDYVLAAADAAGANGEVVSVEVTLDVLSGEVLGWSFGMCHDPMGLHVAGVQIGVDVASINSGGPPFFSFIETLPDGIRVIQVLDFAASNGLSAGVVPYQILVLSYELLAPNQSTTVVDFCNSLGNPATSVEVVVAGQAILPVTRSSTIDIGGGAVTSFVRGNCNSSGGVNIPDAVFLLGYLFPVDIDGDGLPDPNVLACPVACDANDDGSLSIPDVIALLGSLFGAPPVPLNAPTTCGADPTPDALDCSISSCP